MPVVCITGAARRLGKGLALRFAQKGWDIALHVHTRDAAVERLAQSIVEDYSVRCAAVAADVRDTPALNAAITSAAETLGPLDVLVNNAGVFPPQRSLRDVDEKEWDAAMDINVRGQLFAAKAFALYCSANASIVNIGSLGGFEVWKQRLAYNVSKAAVIQLTKGLARELAPRITVNCVAPGIIAIPEDPGDDLPRIPETAVPMQRYGLADDVFEAVYFFAAQGSYITGQTLLVDGGYHLVKKS